MLFDRRSIIRLFWPVMVESTLATMTAFISTVMANGVSGDTVSAVGYISQVNLLILSVFVAISTGITVVVAQGVGGGAVKEASQTAGQSLMALVYFSAAIALLLTIFRTPILNVLFGGVNESVMAQAGTYLLYSSLTLPIWAVYSALAGVMRATGNNVSPMISSMLANIALIAVTWLCIGVFKMGVDAIGCGMVASRAVSAGFLMFMQRRVNGTLALPRFTWKLELKLLMPVVRIALPAGADSFLFNGVKLIMAVFMTGMAEGTMQANVACNNLASILLLPGGAISTIVVTMVGQAYGAGRVAEAKKYMLRMIGLTSLLQAAVTLVLWPFLDTLLLMNTNASAAAMAKPVLVAYMLFSIIFWAPSFVAPNALRGAGDAAYTMYSSLLSLFAVRLFGSWFLGVYLGWGLMGIWVAMMADWVGRGLFYMPRILSGRWNKKKAEANGPL